MRSTLTQEDFDSLIYFRLLSALPSAYPPPIILQEECYKYTTTSIRVACQPVRKRYAARHNDSNKRRLLRRTSPSDFPIQTGLLHLERQQHTRTASHPEQSFRLQRKKRNTTLLSSFGEIVRHSMHSWTVRWYQAAHVTEERVYHPDDAQGLYTCSCW